MQFENTTSEIIDNELEVLSLLNGTPTACAQEVTRSKVRREENKNTKKQKNNQINDKINEIDNNDHHQRNGIKKCRFQKNTIKISNNHNNNQINNQTRIQTNNR